MNITLVGAGMGTPETLTLEALERLRAADGVVGSPRLLAALPPGIGAERIPEPLPANIPAVLDARPHWRSACVVLSGDTGFHSGAERLLGLLRGREDIVDVMPGISSPQYFAARLRRPWQGVRLVSAHGVDCDALAETLNHPSVLFLTGGRITPAEIMKTLCAAGLGRARVSVGENLSLPAERIVSGTAAELAGADFAPLAVVLVDNDLTFAREPGSAGIPDGEFVRGGAPMTKREVRAVALSLLELRPADAAWDVGAGTGSVSVEMALAARRGRVHAVERDGEALALLSRNREKFGAYNMIPVAGKAPEALAALPPPDAAFIGGSGGELPEIMEAALAKNPRCRLVAAAITLETLTDAVETMRRLSVRNIEAVQVVASRIEAVGGRSMFKALNPVFLVRGGGG